MTVHIDYYYLKTNVDYESVQLLTVQSESRIAQKDLKPETDLYIPTDQCSGALVASSN